MGEHRSVDTGCLPWAIGLGLWAIACALWGVADALTAIGAKLP